MVIISNVKWYLNVVTCSLHALFDFLVAQNTASKVFKTARGASTCVILFLLDDAYRLYIEAEQLQTELAMEPRVFSIGG